MATEIRFDKLTPSEFATLIQRLLWLRGFSNVERRDGPGDRGRDFVATFTTDLSGVSPQMKNWAIQCKRSPTLQRGDIDHELSHFRGAQIDGWLLCTSAVGTPQLRQWFDDVVKSKHWPFEIQAWWSDTLERMIYENEQELRGTLKPNLLRKLSLRVANRASSFGSVIARLKTNVEAQIHKYARSKYIPALYTNRALQQDIDAFHATEVEHSARFRRNAMDALAQMSHAISDLTSDLLERESPWDVAVRDKPGLDVWNKFKRELISSASPMIQSLEYAIEGVADLFSEIPPSRIFDHISKLNALHLRLRTIRELLARLTFEALPASIQKKGQVEKEKSQTRVSEWSALRYPNSSNALEMSINALIIELERVTLPINLIVDRAGGGKTSLLCHVASALADNSPVILIFGKQVDRSKTALVDYLQESLAHAFDTRPSDALEKTRSQLSRNGATVHLFIDGINECRNVELVDSAIELLMDKIIGARVRVTMTCRDIYWPFFSKSTWTHLIQRSHIDTLRNFSDEEYNRVLPLYLDHYHIKCNLSSEALHQCKHPLLLRFFCEAYGRLDGAPMHLGAVADIRLLELFDQYLVRKTEQICQKLAHANNNNCLSFLLQLVQYLFTHNLRVIPALKVTEATGVVDLSSQESIYLALLDEDIIIEEEVSSSPNNRLTTFVYEAFMEYMAARALLERSSSFEIDSERALVKYLDELSRHWINAKGTAEFIGVMLLAEPEARTRFDGVTFLRSLLESSHNWLSIFWSILGKLDPMDISDKLCDLVPTALARGSRLGMVRDALRLLNRADHMTSTRLAGVLMWSCLFDEMTIRWQDLADFRSSPNQVRAKLAAKIHFAVARKAGGGKSVIVAADGLDPAGVFNAALPFLDTEVKKIVEEKIRKLGEPTTGARPEAILRLLWEGFPENRLLALNGLISWSRGRRDCVALLKSIDDPPELVALIKEALNGHNKKALS